MGGGGFIRRDFDLRGDDFRRGEIGLGGVWIE